MQNLLMDIALATTPYIGAVTARKLIAKFGSAQNIFAQSEESLRQAKVPTKAIPNIIAKSTLPKAEQIAEICQRQNVKIIVRNSSPLYPTLLSECKDAPHILYQYGDININNFTPISLVGTRNATKTGLENTSIIVEDIAKNIKNALIVSGLAYGIDKHSHLSALKNNIPTVAFLPGWVLNITPAPHSSLAKQIVESGGAILSDMHPGTIVSKGSFISRNRLIAGVSIATIVVESPKDGGSTRTAAMAKAYERATFAIPTRTDDTYADGNNKMIKAGVAQLYQNSSDIPLYRALQSNHTPTQTPKSHNDIDIIYSVMSEGHFYSLDEITQLACIPIKTVICSLAALEKKGIVQSISGGLYMKCRF